MWLEARSPRNHPACRIEVAPSIADPTDMYEAFIRRLENISNQNTNNEDRLLERFHALQLKYFARTDKP